MTVASDNNDAFTLVAPSDPLILPVVRSLVETVGQLAGLDQAARYEAVLAANEACSNVIGHSHQGRRELKLTLTCRVTAEGLEMRVEDEGPPFDFTAVPEIDPTALRQGGRGVLMIRQFMDEAASEPRPQGGNVLRMFKRKSGSPA